MNRRLDDSLDVRVRHAAPTSLRVTFDTVEYSAGEIASQCLGCELVDGLALGLSDPPGTVKKLRLDRDILGCQNVALT